MLMAIPARPPSEPEPATRKTPSRGHGAQRSGEESGARAPADERGRGERLRGLRCRLEGMGFWGAASTAGRGAEGARRGRGTHARRASRQSSQKNAALKRLAGGAGGLGLLGDQRGSRKTADRRSEGHLIRRDGRERRGI